MIDTECHNRLIKDIKETAKQSDTKVEVNYRAGYIAVDMTADDGYLFQDDDMSTLEEEYENSGVANYVSLEEYLKYVSIDW